MRIEPFQKLSTPLIDAAGTALPPLSPQQQSAAPGSATCCHRSGTEAPRCTPQANQHCAPLRLLLRGQIYTSVEASQ